MVQGEFVIYMRVLILSNIEWADNNAFGNTMSNLFSGVSDVDIASLYRRSSLPNNDVCKKYYRISNSSIIKNFFSPQKIGDYFEYSDYKPVTITGNSEKKAISFIHKHKLNGIIYFIEDMLYDTKKWENNNFKKFINDFNPDIVFSFTKASKTHLLFLNIIKKYVPDSKIVTFIVDDICSVFSSNKHKKIIEEQLKQASKIYAITPSLKKKYEKLFDVEIDILTKGCDFSFSVTEKQNHTKTIVYAGNLLYGRDKTLIKLGQEIKLHNDISKDKLLLKIYSPTVVDTEIINRMNISGASEFLGAKSYDEILKILNSADVVLHVESFEEEQKKVVKHSFSTKITDCMQSGSVLFSIGAKGLASIDISSEIPGTFVAHSYNEIGDVVKKIAGTDLYENAKKIREYAIENFAIEKIQEKIITDFKNIL